MAKSCVDLTSLLLSATSGDETINCCGGEGCEFHLSFAQEFWWGSGCKVRFESDSCVE